VGIQSVAGALKAAKMVQMGGRAFGNPIEVRIDGLRCFADDPCDEPPSNGWILRSYWNGLMSLRQPKRFNDLDTEADGLDFGCSSNAITGSAEVSTRQETGDASG
jgi:hypothetical protein